MPDLTRELNQRLVSDVLVCPLCGAPVQISPDGRSLLCRGPKTHCYDGGGGGYLPLAPRHSGGGDSKIAVQQRTAFLSKGYYQPVADALCDQLAERLPPTAVVLDAGCGEGYYTNRMAARGLTVLGVDLSKFAVDAAARAAGRTRVDAPSQTVFAVGSVFALPVRDASIDAVTNVFAPCAPDEYARVLTDGGYLIVVSAGAEHLLGLKQCIYDDPYLNEPRRDLPTPASGLTLVDQQTVCYDICVTGHEDLEALFSMTPYYWRTSPEGHERLARVDTLTTSVAFDLYIYQKRVG